MGGHVGGSYSTTLNRLQGVVLGSLGAYIAFTGVNGNPWGVAVIMPLLVAIFNYPRYAGSAHSYAGYVAGFLVPAAMLSEYGSLLALRDSALTRIQQAFIGIAVFMVVELFVFPSRAETLLKQTIVRTIRASRQAILQTIDSHTGDSCVKCQRAAAASVYDQGTAIEEMLVKQGALIKEASVEPELWRPPFEKKVFQIIVGLGWDIRLYLLLLFRGLSQASVSSESDGELMEIITPISVSLRKLRDDLDESLNLVAYSLEYEDGNLPDVVFRLTKSLETFQVRARVCPFRCFCLLHVARLWDALIALFALFVE